MSTLSFYIRLVDLAEAYLPGYDRDRIGRESVHYGGAEDHNNHRVQQPKVRNDSIIIN